MRILMMGTGTFAEPAFREICKSSHTIVGLVTNPDRAKGRPGRDLEMERPIKVMASERNIPTFQPEDVNTAESIEHIRSTFSPDLFLVAAYGRILSPQLLEVPKLGGINIHSSLLPKYRGAAPILWAIYNGEVESGVTIIRMSPRMDAGDILGTVTEPILPTDTAGTLEARLSEKGAVLACGIVEKLATGPLEGYKQDVTKVTKAPKLTKEMGLVDFNRSAKLVDCQVRAMQPWPFAYSHWIDAKGVGHRLIVHQVQVAESVSSGHAPGEVLHVDKEKVTIGCGNNSAVHLVTIQPPGKRVMAMAEFLRGHSIQAGHRFGAQP